MSTLAKNTRATVIPCLRYRDAPAAIAWLCQAFAFEKQLVVPNEDGTIAHAQLTFGNGMVMLGSVLKAETEFGRLMKQPDEIGGAETQSAYVVVSDADAIYARGKLQVLKSSSGSRTKTIAGTGSVAVTLRVISGTLAPMIHGDAQPDAPADALHSTAELGH